MASDAKTSSHIEAVFSVPGAQAAELYCSGKAGGRYKGWKYLLACGPASSTGSSICRPDGWGVLSVWRWPRSAPMHRIDPSHAASKIFRV